MDEIRKAVPWPLLDISTIGCKTYMVLPGITFSYKLKKTGQNRFWRTFLGIGFLIGERTELSISLSRR